MKKIHYLLCMAVALIAASCSNEQEDFFSDSSANRANAQVKNTIEVLSGADNGWIMQYFPGDPATYGGYNMIIKFEKDGQVTVANELAASEYTETSYYSVKQSAGIMLSFDTYNQVFHVFSDPSAPLSGDQGEGMSGDYDFSVMKAEADQVVLKGRRQGTYAILTPMQQGKSWTEYLNNVKEVRYEMQSLNYTLKVNGKEIPGSPYRRTLKFQVDDEQGNPMTVTLPYVYSENGMKAYQPVNIEGVDITGFTYSEGGSYKEMSGANVTLDQKVMPLNQLLIDYQWFCNYSDMGTFGKKAWAYFGRGLNELGDILLYAFFGTYNDRFGFHFVSYSTTDGNHYSGGLNYKYTLVGDNKIRMQFAENGYGSGAWYYQNAKMDYALYPFGYSKEKTFTITTDNPKMPSYLILSDDNDKTNVIKLSYSVVSFPFLEE